MIAFTNIICQSANRPARMEFAKAIILAVTSFICAANQFWPDMRQATRFNDIAIALFVFDVLLVIVD